MTTEVLKFFKTEKDGEFRVEIWGDFRKEFGVMDFDEMRPFLDSLRAMAATTQQVIDDLRNSPEGVDFFLEKLKRTA